VWEDVGDWLYDEKEPAKVTAYAAVPPKRRGVTTSALKSRSR
jgi:hypothetical protein